MLTDKSVREFISALRDAYEDSSELSEICQLTSFKDASHPQKEDYIQVGRKTWFPKAIIEDGISKFNAEEIARRLAEAEVVSVISSLNSLANSGTIKSDSTNNLTTESITRAVRNLNSPDHIFIPQTNELWDFRWDLADRGLVEYEENKELLKIGGAQMEIHMVQEESDIDDIFIIDSEHISVIQKSDDEALDPQGEEDWNMYPQFNSGEEFMLYTNGKKYEEDDEDFPRKVLILYRVVFSEASVSSENAAYRVTLT